MRRLCALCAVLLVTLPAAYAGQDRLAGNWKVTFFDRGDLLTFWMLKLETKDGKLVAALDNAPKGPNAAIHEFTVKDDRLSFNIKFQGQSIDFVCKVPKGDLKKLRGSMSFSGRAYPVTLESTKLESLKDTNPFAEAPEPKGNFKELKELIAKQSEEITVFELADVLVREAATDKASLADLKDGLAPVLKAAELYGEAWVTEFRFQLASRLSAREAFASFGQELAEQAVKATSGGSAEAQLRALGILASSLQKQGKQAELVKLQQHINGLEEKGHEENEKAGLGFTPAKFEGRKGNRAILVELFTGAQCPPCVAADLAFEGLAKTYKPTEVVLLQYHLHIPGPDALTSEDTVARQRYYGKNVRGTPSIFFNGKSEAGGGGGKPQAEGKYNQYRGIVTPLLDEKTAIKLDLTAKQNGEAIDIAASASGYKPGDKIKLRLALVEPWVRYQGNNGLSYHAHVVRALPGGPDGFTLAKDNAKETAKVNLGNLRQAVSKYLDGIDELAGQRPLNYRHLHVIAFVQDDETQEVLHAVEVAVK